MTPRRKQIYCTMVLPIHWYRWRGVSRVDDRRWWHLDRIMSSSATAHDTAVQMIDTSIARLHQQTLALRRMDNGAQHVGRWLAGLTTKVHAVSVDLYRSRNLVERLFSKIKQCRRIATATTSSPPITSFLPGCFDQSPERAYRSAP
jgi:transposase